MLKVHEKGFSMIRMMVWCMILGGSGLYITTLWPIYNTYWKVQDTFDGVAKNLSSLSEQSIRERLPQLLRTQYLNPQNIPQEFYDHLDIESDGEAYIKISSSYHVTGWFLGKPDLDQSEEGKGGTVEKQWNHLRRQWKEEFEFKPYAASAYEAP